MTPLTVSVSGIPKGQPRPRAFAKPLGGGKFAARVYDSGTAEGWKSAVAEAFRPHLPQSPWECPFTCSMRFLFPRPKRLQTKKRANADIPYLSKPDCDNAAKAILDTLTQIGFWRDDVQVCSLWVVKRYVRSCEPFPGALITVERMS